MSFKPHIAEAYHDVQTFDLLEEPIDRARPLRVVIGTHFSASELH